jgi:hypothetical protein
LKRAGSISLKCQNPTLSADGSKRLTRMSGPISSDGRPPSGNAISVSLRLLRASVESRYYYPVAIVNRRDSDAKSSTSVAITDAIEAQIWVTHTARNVRSRLQSVQTSISLCFLKVPAVSISLSRSSPPHVQRNEGGGSTRGRTFSSRCGAGEMCGLERPRGSRVAMFILIRPGELARTAGFPIS